MADKKVSWEIVEHIGTITEKEKGWNKELNLVKWGENEPKYDIRDWNEDHTYCGKGITLTVPELYKLFELIADVKTAAELGERT